MGINEFTLAVVFVTTFFVFHLIYFNKKMGSNAKYFLFLSAITAIILTESYHYQYHVTWEHGFLELAQICIIIFIVLLVISFLIQYFSKNYEINISCPKYQYILCAFFLIYFVSGLFFSGHYDFAVINQGTKDLLNGHLYVRYYEFAGHNYPYPPIFPIFSLLFYLLPLKDIYCMRLALSFAQILLLHAIYKICMLKETKYGHVPFFLIATNPINYYFISIHTQFDCLCIALLLYSMYFFHKKRYIFSSVFFALSIATKYFPILFFPYFLLSLKKIENSKKAFKYSIFVISLVILIYIPFFLIDGFKNVTNGIIFESLTRNPAGFSIPSIFFRIDQNFAILSALFPIIYVIFTINMIKKSKYSSDFFSKEHNKILIQILAIFFIFSKSLHIQYFIWVMPFYYFNLKRL